MAAQSGTITQIRQNATSGRARVTFAAPASPALVAGDRFDVTGSSVGAYDRRFVVESVMSASIYNVLEGYAGDATNGAWTEFLDPIRVGPLEAGSIDAGTLQAGQLHPG